MGRTILVGDVHGCADELDELFDRVALARDDNAIMVGDLIARGPDPQRVLEIVREVGARSVRGNHEERLLRWRKRRRADRPLAHASALGRIAAQLTAPDWELLESLPLYLQVPEHGLLVVHAGLVPGTPLQRQTLEDLLWLRGITSRGLPTERRDHGTLWGALYEGPPHVVFGHNAQTAPQLHPWATGIDTGCVYGGALTAMVLERGASVPPVDTRQEVLVSVAAHRIHCPI